MSWNRDELPAVVFSQGVICPGDYADVVTAYGDFVAVYVVTYTYLPQPQDLARLRPERYEFFKDLDARGVLLASGQVLDSEIGEGMLVVDAPTLEAASEILDSDPFVKAGLVARRTIAAWNPTIGAWVS